MAQINKPNLIILILNFIQVLVLQQSCYRSRFSTQIWFGLNVEVSAVTDNVLFEISDSVRTARTKISFSNDSGAEETSNKYNLTAFDN